MARRRIIGRNYLCSECGKLRRALASYVPNAPPAPRCCAKEMKILSYEQTVAATRLKQMTRVRWVAAGGKVVRASGKRRWKAVR